jgi:hypothetical protein
MTPPCLPYPLVIKKSASEDISSLKAAVTPKKAPAKKAAVKKVAAKQPAVKRRAG